MSTVIEDIAARKIFNSRGEETIEIDIFTPVSFGRVAAPAGASKGKNEVVYYPVGGVDKALKKVEELIAPQLIGMNADAQEEIDNMLHEIDETDDFHNIGGNTAYAVSLAATEAAANSYGLPIFQYLGGQLANRLPYPLGNIVSGGAHTSGKTPEIQEFLSLPQGATSFHNAAKANVLIHKRANALLEKADSNFVSGRSDEGAWIANITSEKAFEILDKAREEVSAELGFECRIGIDFAASTLWDSKEKRYVYPRSGGKKSSEQQSDFVLSLIGKYKLAYIEDPFHEEDFESYAWLVKKAKKCLICGDDLFTTNVKRLEKGIQLGAANSIIVKVNQVGTLTDALATVNTAKNMKYVPVMSHRSGDTANPHIAHLAVGLQCPIIKTGVVEGARVPKINELLRIEEMLGSNAQMSTLRL